MSRIGKKPIQIPKDVQVRLEGDIISVKGPKGKLTRELHPKVAVDVADEHIAVSVPDESKASKSLQGLTRMLIDNMVTGVTKGFEKALEIVGVGYRVEIQDRTAVLNLGYSHPIHFELPDGIEAKVEKTKIVLSGIDREVLGMTAAKMRSFRRPEPYKGKGLRYEGERVRRKAGKAGAAA
jgi:large subunit ribosomal protein L6